MEENASADRQQNLDAAVQELRSLVDRLAVLDSKASGLAAEHKIEQLLDVCDELRELHVNFIDAHRALMNTNAIVRFAQRQRDQPVSGSMAPEDCEPVRF